MIGDHLEAILKNASAKLDKDGYHTAPEGVLFTLYVAHDGASLTIHRVDGLRLEKELAYARTQKKETFALVQADVFAVALEGTAGQPVRRAGFG